MRYGVNFGAPDIPADLRRRLGQIRGREQRKRFHVSDCRSRVKPGAMPDSEMVMAQLVGACTTPGELEAMIVQVGNGERLVFVQLRHVAGLTRACDRGGVLFGVWVWSR